METTQEEEERKQNIQYLSDGVGFVELLGVFGDDLTVVNAARVSLNKESLELDDKDRRLIRYLAAHNHLSPFFHPQLRFRIKMPIYVAREWYRHTVGFARNEVSRRYVSSDPECWVPSKEGLRERSESIKQGSKPEAVDNSSELHQRIASHMQQSCELYNQLVESKVAPEVARVVLPQSMYTEFIETASLYAYLRLIKLRQSADAQVEIASYASLITGFLYRHFPVSYSAFF
jgi:thymidylate synthase (FAD)